MSDLGKEVDEKLLRRMFSMIRLEEANNLKTGKLNDQQMVLLIANIIKKNLEEADRNEV